MTKRHTIHRFLHPKLHNPYKHHKPHIFRIKGSVLLSVIGPTLFITTFSAIIVILFEKTDIKPSIPFTLITVIGLVVGLLLSYRTNTAYDRYWEGRKLWSTMTTAIRNFTRCIWVNVEGENSTQIILEKKTAINLLVGFAVATKRYLRKEHGYTYKDIRPFISSIIFKLPGFDPDIKEEDDDTNKITTIWDQILHRTRKELANNEEKEKDTHLCLPLAISLYLSSYIHYNSSKKKPITHPITLNMISCLNTMVDCLTQFERILESPTPLAYSVHLSQTVWVYCLSLPFQLVGQAHWATIPIVFFASMILLGIERIAAEIENPFGYDPNDLQLDDFCGVIKNELNIITSHSIPTMNDWVFTEENHPFEGENQNINAMEANKFSTERVRSLLVVNMGDQQQNNNAHDNDNSLRV